MDSRYSPSNYWYFYLSLKARQLVHNFFYRNGRWRSIWTVSYKSPSSIQIKGVVKVQIHYYEDGNVQVNINREPEATISASAVVYYAEFV